LDLVGDSRERLLQPSLDPRNGEMGDVDADPLAFELLRRMDSGSATAERVEDQI
jgi:hypothetical protein